MIESITLYPIDDDGHLTGDRHQLTVRLFGAVRLPPDPPTVIRDHTDDVVLPQPNTGYAVHLINPRQHALHGPHWDWHQRCAIEVVFHPSTEGDTQIGHLFPLVDQWSPDVITGNLSGRTLRHNLTIGPHLPRWNAQADLIASGRSYGYSRVWSLTP
jgi:hypothetical protein